ncbi:P-loop containing nucleoside triphosphate hydrolase protein [Pluteus cervinus]|uniref:P-loop containing nucleoside triphosphate hydrolase protein n=1 Tax=Pluteus cervinus TaxID=181527 RepID=A0ACD3BG30_9AGAR|nr:P-loop containing nucleoside triphosphate hydrolase protein [Pluteus cervinus]
MPPLSTSRDFQHCVCQDLLLNISAHEDMRPCLKEVDACLVRLGWDTPSHMWVVDDPTVLAIVIAASRNADLHRDILLAQLDSQVKLASTTAYRAVQQLCAFFLDHPEYMNTRAAAGNSDSVKGFKHALDVLGSMEFRAPPRKAGKGKNVQVEDTLLTQVFMESTCVPETAAERDVLVQRISKTLQEILEVCFIELRVAERKEDLIEMLHLPASRRAPDELTRPDRPAHLFDTDDIEGFGIWQILISQRAERNLRKLRKKERVLFDRAYEKLQQLSHGHLGDQGILSGVDGIPIYIAKPAHGLRIVYHIYCVPSSRKGEEIQAIRIFGFYEPKQIKLHIWNTVSCQLGKNDEEFIQRCSLHPSNYVIGEASYIPATFEPQTRSSPAVLPPVGNQSPGDLDELHGTIHQKYTHFSKKFLDAIIGDIAITFPFQLYMEERRVVEYPHTSYVIGRSGSGKTTIILLKILLVERNYWNGTSPSKRRPRQMFVTKSHLLANRVEHQFYNYASATLPDLASRPTQDVDDFTNLLDYDDNQATFGLSKNNLPLKFSELEDHHFPLFITFDDLCNLIEGDLTSVIGSRKKPLVNWSTFQQHYWSHMPEPLKKGVDPTAVYSEFLGVIKGSEEAYNSQIKVLDLSTYEALGEQHSSFIGKRTQIYSLFEKYSKLKQERQEEDIADRTIHIVQSLMDEEAGKPCTDNKVDWIYVDEAQDNLLLDSLILHAICSNGDHMIWAGDTAQTIAAGSSFKFDELKAFLYRTNEKTMSLKAHTFHLSTNFRSHAGIINCAQSVIDLIVEFWPNSIDKLTPEVGVVSGPRPVWLKTREGSNEHVDNYLEKMSTQSIEFGAEQCILVHNEKALQSFQQKFGQLGIVLTLLDSKGLEFNDVLLYNFFQDSHSDETKWRHVLTNTQSFHSNPSEYVGLCQELKLLYVAITRARKNFWIADTSPVGDMIKQFWLSQGLIQELTLGVEILSFGRSSNREEWALRGKAMFDAKKYEDAARCYQHAGYTHLEEIAWAYKLRQDAWPMTGSRKSKTFIQAAEAFHRSAHHQSNEKYRLPFARLAADCFLQVGLVQKAVDTMLAVKEYTQAAMTLYEAGKIDESVALVRRYPNEIEPAARETITTSAKEKYFRELAFSKARQLFETTKDAVGYLKERKFDLETIGFLEWAGEVSTAAKLHTIKGRFADAIKLLSRHARHPCRSNHDPEIPTKSKHPAKEITRYVGEYTLELLWRSQPFGVAATRHGALVNEVLTTMAEIKWPFTPEVQKQIEMFKYLRNGLDSVDSLQKLGEGFQTTCWYAYMRCLSVALRQFPDDKNIHQIHSYLSRYRDFINSLAEMSKGDGFGQSTLTENLARLFGFRETENKVWIPAGTFFSEGLSDDSKYQGENGTALSRHEFTVHFRRVLSQWLVNELKSHSVRCQKLPQMSPHFLLQSPDCRFSPRSLSSRGPPVKQNPQRHILSLQFEILTLGGPDCEALVQCVLTYPALRCRVLT